MSTTALYIAQSYFDAWNQHDSAAIVAVFNEGGTYSNPATFGPLTGAAIRAYAEALWVGFPDLSFNVGTVSEDEAGLVCAQWQMKGTNTGNFMGLPPSGISVVLAGADFIQVEGDRIRSVQGYFDSAAMPRALGLDVIVQPKALGPVAFGTSKRVSGGSNAIPGAFSITWIDLRSEQEHQKVAESGQKIVQEMTHMPGFISWVGVDVGGRMMTITAWETAEAVGQMMMNSEHLSAVGQFFGPELGNSGATGVWIPCRLNPRRLRCGACSKIVDAEKAQGRCKCGAALPALPAYW